ASNRLYLTVVVRSHCPNGQTEGHERAHLQRAKRPLDRSACLGASVVQACRSGFPEGIPVDDHANGYRAYYVVYRARGIRRGRASPIGPAEDFSYREAFKKAESIRWLVADGRDPFGEQREAADRKRSLRIVTVRDALDYFIEVHKDQRDVKTTQAYEQTRN